MSSIRRAEVSSLTKIGGGGFVIVNASTPVKKWKGRPWQTLPSYNNGMKRWEVRIYPGFVNGEDPTCEGYLPDDSLADRGRVRELDLFFSPYIPINGFRDIDGQMESIPAFFKARGVRKDRALQIQGEKVVIDGTPDDPTLPARRYLKAADIWVAVARATYEMETTVTGNLVTGQLVDYSVSFDTTQLDRVGARARLLVGPQFPAKKPTTLMDLLNGVYQDEGEDREIISTVYLLSPPEELEADVSLWKPYVKHHRGWNLLHAAKNDPPKRTPQTTVDSGLAAFVGRYTIVPQATLGAMEAEIQRQLAALQNATSNEGKFWTL